LLLTSARAASSPDSALDAYQRGNFRSAQAQYSQLAKQKADDARLRFNAGAAAYKNNDLTNAATWFESAAGAPDLNLQQQAYYNLGNTRYRLGESAPDPQARMKEWEQSLQHYGSALKLNQTDTNAAANLAFVQQALQQLKQQQPPPSGKDGKDGKDNQDPQDPQDQPTGSQSQAGQPPSDPNQSTDPQDSAAEQKDASAQAGKPPSDPQKDGAPPPDKEAAQDPQAAPDEQSKAPKEGEDAQAQAAKPAGQAAGKEGSGREGEAFADEAGKPGEMSPVQAERLLDQQKSDEKALMFRAGGNGKPAGQRPRRNLKPW
jgi:Ca-activated chloride channel family protein